MTCDLLKLFEQIISRPHFMNWTPPKRKRSLLRSPVLHNVQNIHTKYDNGNLQRAGHKRC